MPIYRCRVVTPSGRTDSIVREATSEEVLIRELAKEEIYPLEVHEAAELTVAGATRRPFSRRSVLEFTGTLSLLLSSGLTFRDALEIAQTIFRKGDLNRMTVHLLQEIRKGASVHGAMEALGRAFPQVLKGFVRIGEKLGTLEGTFKQLTEYLEEERKVRDKMTSALVYPVLVLSVAVVGITGIVTFVLPRVRDMFGQIGAGLPERIQNMLGLLDSATILGASLLAAATVAAVALTLLRRQDTPLAQRLDQWLLKVPFIGRMRYLAEMLNLLFAMEILTAGGFSVEDALAESAEIVTSRAFRAGLLTAREAVMKGESLSGAFLANPVFSERLGRWIAVGERSGRVEEVFKQLRRYYQGEMEKWTARFMSLVEPVLLLLVGLVIFGIVFFFVTPIFSVYEGIL